MSHGFLREPGEPLRLLRQGGFVQGAQRERERGRGDRVQRTRVAVQEAGVLKGAVRFLPLVEASRERRHLVQGALQRGEHGLVAVTAVPTTQPITTSSTICASRVARVEPSALSRAGERTPCDAGPQARARHAGTLRRVRNLRGGGTGRGRPGDGTLGSPRSLTLAAG
ncbi:hypothetical protein ABZY02_32035 [Streptomyces sp. NPDC006649]|uniref:hypothetical protein n=1 Tax=Streptomyces sp. NPDC006649 TaxID=3156896 RepID=UPI0033A50740